MKPVMDESALAVSDQAFTPALDVVASAGISAFVPPAASRQLLRMFRDPRVLERQECADLVADLRRAVELAPQSAEIRVILGMALCVNLEAHEALEQLRVAAGQSPTCFIARLKYGELLMRLRICDRAAEETHAAARLAANAAQADLARRQAATIRTMTREGIERGGYKGLLPRWMSFRRRNHRAESTPTLASSR